MEELDEDALLYGDSVYASLFKKSSTQPTPEFLNKVSDYNQTSHLWITIFVVPWNLQYPNMGSLGTPKTLI